MGVTLVLAAKAGTRAPSAFFVAVAETSRIDGSRERKSHQTGSTPFEFRLNAANPWATKHGWIPSRVASVWNQPCVPDVDHKFASA